MNYKKAKKTFYIGESFNKFFQAVNEAFKKPEWVANTTVNHWRVRDSMKIYVTFDLEDDKVINGKQRKVVIINQQCGDEDGSHFDLIVELAKMLLK